MPDMCRPGTRGSAPSTARPAPTQGIGGTKQDTFNMQRELLDLISFGECSRFIHTLNAQKKPENRKLLSSVAQGDAELLLRATHREVLHCSQQVANS